MMFWLGVAALVAASAAVAVIRPKIRGGGAALPEASAPRPARFSRGGF